jgi:hypothetical protein
MNEKYLNRRNMEKLQELFLLVPTALKFYNNNFVF